MDDKQYRHRCRTVWGSIARPGVRLCDTLLLNLALGPRTSRLVLKLYLMTSDMHIKIFEDVHDCCDCVIYPLCSEKIYFFIKLFLMQSTMAWSSAYKCEYTMHSCRFDHFPLQWRHNGRDSVSNHQPRDCFLSRLFRHRSTKTSKLRVTGLCVGNSPETGEFPAQVASNADNVSIWWRHHEQWRNCKGMTRRWELLTKVLHSGILPFL